MHGEIPGQRCIEMVLPPRSPSRNGPTSRNQYPPGNTVCQRATTRKLTSVISKPNTAKDSTRVRPKRSESEPHQAVVRQVRTPIVTAMARFIWATASATTGSLAHSRGSYSGVYVYVKDAVPLSELYSGLCAAHASCVYISTFGAIVALPAAAANGSMNRNLGGAYSQYTCPATCTPHNRACQVLGSGLTTMDSAACTTADS